MTNRTVREPQRPGGAIRVYTVRRDGSRTEPQTAVSVPYGDGPPPWPVSEAFPCACPVHRAAESGR
ncbi:hypothetical protein [Streptomyces similanensis]|uniref:MbtH family protein n=1 Tax=Streptomyces similanensis TaxID=1274988 RepID=A0ABP9KNL0_9ACTN